MKPSGALIGFGAIAQTTHLGALEQTGLEVVAVVETSEPRREAARLALPGARLYRDVDALFVHEPHLQFVDICTPPHLHYDAAVKAIRAGLHVLCEKPLVLLPEHGAHLAQLAAEHHVVVTCVHNWIYAPILLRAAALLRQGVIGELQHMQMHTLRTKPAAAAGDNSNWRVDPAKSGGGILFDHGWHGMSILLRTIDAAPLWVEGAVQKRRYTKLVVEDSSETDVMFMNGVTARFVATWAAETRANEVILRGTDGRIEVRDDRLQVLRGDAIVLTETFGESLAAGGYRPTWTAGVVRAFKDEIDHTERRGASLREALGALQLIMATYTASRENRRVVLTNSQPVQASITPDPKR